ncbi:MAG: neuraminidase-like domain-containing protein [Burkholderiales bacterium]
MNALRNQLRPTALLFTAFLLSTSGHLKSQDTVDNALRAARETPAPPSALSASPQFVCSDSDHKVFQVSLVDLHLSRSAISTLKKFDICTVPELLALIEDESVFKKFIDVVELEEKGGGNVVRQVFTKLATWQGITGRFDEAVALASSSLPETTARSLGKSHEKGAQFMSIYRATGNAAASLGLFTAGPDEKAFRKLQESPERLSLFTRLYAKTKDAKVSAELAGFDLNDEAVKKLQDDAEKMNGFRSWHAKSNDVQLSVDLATADIEKTTIAKLEEGKDVWKTFQSLYALTREAKISAEAATSTKTDVPENLIFWYRLSGDAAASLALAVTNLPDQQTKGLKTSSDAMKRFTEIFAVTKDTPASAALATSQAPPNIFAELQVSREKFQVFKELLGRQDANAPLPMAALAVSSATKDQMKNLMSDSSLRKKYQATYEAVHDADVSVALTFETPAVRKRFDDWYGKTRKPNVAIAVAAEDFDLDKFSGIYDKTKNPEASLALTTATARDISGDELQTILQSSSTTQQFADWYGRTFDVWTSKTLTLTTSPEQQQDFQSWHELTKGARAHLNVLDTGSGKEAHASQKLSDTKASLGLATLPIGKQSLNRLARSRDTSHEFLKWHSRIDAVLGDPIESVSPSVAIATTPLQKDILERMAKAPELLKDFLYWYGLSKDARSSLALATSATNGEDRKSLAASVDKLNGFRLWNAATRNTPASVALALSKIGTERIEDLTVEKLAGESKNLIDKKRLGELLAWMKGMEGAAALGNLRKATGKGTLDSIIQGKKPDEEPKDTPCRSCAGKVGAFDPVVYLAYLLDFTRRSFPENFKDEKAIETRLRQDYGKAKGISTDATDDSDVYIKYTNENLEALGIALDKDPTQSLDKKRRQLYKDFAIAELKDEQGFEPGLLADLYDSYLRELGIDWDDLYGYISLGEAGIDKLEEDKLKLTKDTIKLADFPAKLEDSRKTRESIDILQIDILRGLVFEAYVKMAVTTKLTEEYKRDMAEEERRLADVATDSARTLIIQDYVSVRNPNPSDLESVRQEALRCIDGTDEEKDIFCHKQNGELAQKWRRPYTPLFELLVKHIKIFRPGTPAGQEEAVSITEYPKLLASPPSETKTCVRPYEPPPVLDVEVSNQTPDPAQYDRALAIFLECISTELFNSIGPALKEAFDSDVEEEKQFRLKEALGRAETGFHQRLRTNLAAVVLRRLAGVTQAQENAMPYPKVTKPYLASENVAKLTDYLFIDLTVDESYKTTRVAAAIRQLQTLFQAVELGTEKNIKGGVDSATWRWLSSYGTWHAAMNVESFPENFLFQHLRTTATPQFLDALHAEDIEPSSNSINYLEAIEKIAGLQILKSFNAGDYVLLVGYAAPRNEERRPRYFYTEISADGSWSAWKSLDDLGDMGLGMDITFSPESNSLYFFRLLPKGDAVLHPREEYDRKCKWLFSVMGFNAIEAVTSFTASQKASRSVELQMRTVPIRTKSSPIATTPSMESTAGGSSAGSDWQTLLGEDITLTSTVTQKKTFPNGELGFYFCSQDGIITADFDKPLPGLTSGSSQMILSSDLEGETGFAHFAVSAVQLESGRDGKQTETVRVVLATRETTPAEIHRITVTTEPGGRSPQGQADPLLTSADDGWSFLTKLHSVIGVGGPTTAPYFLWGVSKGDPKATGENKKVRWYVTYDASSSGTLLDHKLPKSGQVYMTQDPTTAGSYPQFRLVFVDNARKVRSTASVAWMPMASLSAAVQDNQGGMPLVASQEVAFVGDGITPTGVAIGASKLFTFFTGVYSQDSWRQYMAVDNGALRLVSLPPQVKDISKFDSAKSEELFKELEEGDPSKNYLEEAFLHLPLLVAERFTEQGQYSEAEKWLKRIYDPNQSSEQKRRIYADFKDFPSSVTVPEYLTRWVTDPFDPYALADLNKPSYLLHVKLRLADNYLQWADRLFALDDNESVNRARELYEQAAAVLNLGGWPDDGCEAAWKSVWDSAKTTRSFFIPPYRRYTLCNEALEVRRDKAKFDAGKWTSFLSQLNAKNQALATSPATAPAASDNKIWASFVSGVASEARKTSFASVKTDRATRLPGIRMGSGQTIADLAALVSLSSETEVPSDALPAPTVIPALVPGLCIPLNPQVDLYRFRVIAALDKIRQNLNYAGMPRQLAPYVAAADPRGFVTGNARRIGNDPTLGGGPVAPPPIYRYGFLLERSKYLATLAQQSEFAYLAAIEKESSERYSLLKAQQDMTLENANVSLQDLRQREASHGLQQAEVQVDRSDYTWGYYDKLLGGGFKTGLSKWEAAALAAQTTAIGFGMLREGHEAGKTILSFGLTGDPGGAAMQLAQATATLMQSIASYHRRYEEWRHQTKLAGFDRKIATLGVSMAQDRLDIVDQEGNIADIRAGFASDTIEFLTSKANNAELYEWMKKNLRRLYREQLNMAVATAIAARHALEFERQARFDFIGNNYWDDDHMGMVGAQRLADDLAKMEQQRLRTAQRKREVQKTISLASVDPIRFEEFKRTGVLDFTTSMLWYDQDFPGHYMRLIRDVSVSTRAVIPPNEAIHATLSNDGVSHVMTGPPFENMTTLYRLPESIAITGAENATGLFELKPDDPMLLPFEGSGVSSNWRLELPKSANRFDFDTIFDVQFTVRYTALEDTNYRNKVLVAPPFNMRPTGIGEIQNMRFFSLRSEFPDQWYGLLNSRPGQSCGAPCNGVEPPPQNTTLASATLELKQFHFLPNEERRNVKKVTLVAAVKQEFDRDKLGDQKLKVDLQFCEKDPCKMDGSEDVSFTVDGKTKYKSTTDSKVTPRYPKTPYGKWILKLTDAASTALSWVSDLILVIEYDGEVQYPR